MIFMAFSKYLYSNSLTTTKASTVDRRALMFRPGVRCNTSLPQGVETTGLDCIGRVVQISTRARAVYGFSIDDRIAAIYPFEYKAGHKERGRRNNKYALVDAGFAVAVPKQVDSAEAACMIRLYLMAFQSILKGVSGIHTDRYGDNQLKGQSILIQNGETELGRVLIELASLLGASQIFATGPTESHPLLVELGAIPLGDKTFSWELFLEEKISLVLVQEIPTEGECMSRMVFSERKYSPNIFYAP
jgi:NADPH:quinone reductase-like Zn-dependent oxidoreductase